MVRLGIEQHAQYDVISAPDQPGGKQCTPGPHLMLFLGLGKIRTK